MIVLSLRSLLRMMDGRAKSLDEVVEPWLSEKERESKIYITSHAPPQSVRNAVKAAAGNC